MTRKPARSSPYLPPIERGEPSHPTWLEQAIQDKTVLYVDKHIEQGQRTFHHERYVNMRGKTIDVRAHDKRIPTSVQHLKQTIYQAIATERGGPSSTHLGTFTWHIPS